MEFTINIFTLNCWGIPIVSKNRKERIQAISKYLLKSSHDVICLQEIWSEKDFNFLQDSLKTNYPYSHYFYSGVLGSGLCMFSKWQIQDVFFHQWPLNGYIHKIHHGDWFGGKGVGLCRIKYNEKLINIYCTHLHAEYHADDIYLAHRVLQAYSTAEFVKLTASSADIAILAGDMNTAPGDLSYRLLKELPALIDPYNLKCKDNTDEKKTFGTCDAANNSYSNPKQAKECPEGKRIDHIFFKINKEWEVDVLNFGDPLEDRVPGQQFSYSDHNAVSLEIRLRSTTNTKVLENQEETEVLDKTIADGIKVCRDALAIISRSKTLYLTVGGLIFMFLLGTVGFWPSSVLYDVIKIIMSAVSFYYIAMGTIWNKIERNSLKAGLTGLENINSGLKDNKLEAAERL